MRQWEHFIAIIKKEVQPALGCTEPTSIAYAAAHAARLLGQKPQRLSVAVSDNLYKNAMGVFVPGSISVNTDSPYFRIHKNGICSLLTGQRGHFELPLTSKKR